MLIFLLFFQLQNGKFNEYYDSGIQAYEEKNYPEAIRLLKKAVELRADSSPNAKISGVRFIEYYPYHYLATAHYLIRDMENAERYMQLAFRNEEDQDKRVAEKLNFLRIFLEDWRTSKAAQTPPVAKVDLSPVFEYIRLKRYQDAIRLLDNMRANDSLNTDLYSMLIRLLDELKSSLDRTEEFNAQRQRNLLNLLEDARAKVASGQHEAAYLSYQKVSFLDPNNREAQNFIADFDLRETETNSEAYQQLLKQVKELRAEKEAKDRELEAAESATQIRLEEIKTLFQKQAVPLPTISLVRISEQMYQISVQYQGESLLSKAILKINGKNAREWVLSQKTNFTVTHNQPLIDQDNLIQVEIFGQDEHILSQGKTHFTPPALPKPPQIRHTFPFLRWLLIVFCLLLFISYWVFQRNQRKAFRLRFNPYIAGAPVMRGDMFYGREALLKQILNTIHNNSLMIYGERRIGKTSFLHQLYKLLPSVEDPEYLFLPVMIDLQGIDETQFFAHLDHEIQLALQQWSLPALEVAPESMDGRVFTQRLRQVIHDLKNACPKAPKLVLLLDEVDIMNGYSERTNQQLRAVFMKGFAHHLVAIMAGIHISKRWKSEGSPWYNFFEQIELRPFSREQAEELVTRPVRGIYRYDPAAVTQILQISACKPYIIQKLCVNLVAHVLNENKRRITERDVQYVYREIQHEVERAV
ncbi:MAG: AAA family ATPase [Acidobacteria bacterium]|nr:AAA family ATPase [Acidobacteriota bacterium]